MTTPWQPTLWGNTIQLRPMRLEDFEPLFLAASEPDIWANHPDPSRSTRPGFQKYFESGIKSGGALVVEKLGEDQRPGTLNGTLIGCSRFYDPTPNSVVIGYTFLIRSHWGGSTNRELKQLMIDHAFRFVPRVEFHVHKDNIRSQKALSKLGINLSGPFGPERPETLIYALERGL